MHRGTDTSFGYLGTGLTAAILYMLSKSVNADLTEYVTLVEKCMYLLPYFFISITLPMLVMGVISPFIRPSLEMRCQYLILTVSLAALCVTVFAAPDDGTAVYRLMAVIIGHFASAVIFIPVSAKNYEKIRKNS